MEQTMKKLSYYFITLIFLSSLTACFSPNWNAVTASMKSWEGAMENELYTSYGPPQGTQTLSNGNKLVMYTSECNLTTGGYMAGNVYIPQDNSTLSCKVMFTIDPAGKIINWSYEGNYGAITRIVKPRARVPNSSVW
jgi:hypothetical protein